MAGVVHRLDTWQHRCNHMTKCGGGKKEKNKETVSLEKNKNRRRAQAQSPTCRAVSRDKHRKVTTMALMRAAILIQRGSTFIGGKFGKISDINKVSTRTAASTRSGAILPEPKTTPFGFVGVICGVVVGLFIGAAISKNVANFLEENDLFVPSDDDDDDD